jgi:hypothetical protein
MITSLRGDLNFFMLRNIVNNIIYIHIYRQTQLYLLKLEIKLKLR